MSAHGSGISVSGVCGFVVCVVGLNRLKINIFFEENLFEQQGHRVQV